MKKEILAIALDDNILKLMQGQTGPRGWKVSKIETEKITGLSEEDLAKVIKDKLHKLKSKRSSIVLTIPRNVVTVKYLQLPTVDTDELKNMVDIQVVRQIPYTREEMVYDYGILGTTEEGYTKVFLVIVHKDVISKYLNILKKAGIEAKSIELDSLAIVQLFRFITALQKGKPEKILSDAPIALVDIGYAATNVIVIERGELPVFTRNVSIGTIHLEGKAVSQIKKDWVSEWIDEINRSLNVFQRDEAVKLEKVLVIGDYKKQLIHILKEKLGIDVSSWDISSWIEGISSEDGVVKLDGVAVSISGLLGAIKEGPVTSVNLIPESTRAVRISRERKKSLILTGILLAGVLSVLALTINKKMQDRQTYLGILEKRLKETGPTAEELAIKKERLALIKDQLSVEGTSLDILKDLYTVIPQKTSLNVFIYDDKLGVTIKGVAPTMSEVFALVPKLEDSSLFENVTSRYATQRKIKGQELTDFHIDLVLEDFNDAS